MPPDELDHPLLDSSLRVEPHVAVHVGCSHDVLVTQKGLDFLQFETRFLAPGAHCVPEAVPADAWKPNGERYRFDVSLEQLGGPEWTLAVGVRRSKDPIPLLIVRSDGAPLAQQLRDFLGQWEVCTRGFRF